MTFRDDHDAALARADALEVELAVERAKNRRLEARLARHDDPPAGYLRGQEDDAVGVVLTIAVILAFVSFVIAIAMA